jgi:hypothetical protein
MKIFLIEAPNIIQVGPHRNARKERVTTAQTIKDALTWRIFNEDEIGFKREERGEITVIELQEKPRHFKRAVAPK